jgi:hypothetical protein
MALGYQASTNGGFGASALAIGNVVQANADRAVAIGFGITQANSNATVAIGNGALASGSRAVAIGESSVASGNDSVAIGLGSVATQNKSIGIGDNSGSSAANSIAIGDGCNANTVRGVAIGFGAGPNWSGTFAFAATTPTGSQGNSGAYTVHQYQGTGDATPTQLFNYGQSGERITLVNNFVLTFRLQVAAIQNGGTAGTVGDSAGWIIDGIIRRNNAGTITLLGSTAPFTFADAGAAAWTAVVSADAVNNALVVTVTGEANKNIRWTGIWSIAGQRLT